MPEVLSAIVILSYNIIALLHNDLRKTEKKHFMYDSIATSMNN